MKKWILAGLVITVSAFYFTGCEQKQKVQKAGDLKEPVLLSVDFEPNQTLIYNFVSERSMYVNLDPSGKYSKGKQDGKEQVQSEKLEMQISYKPVSIDPIGVSVIEATCVSAKVTRTGTGRAQDKADAAETLAGKTFTLKISPTGKIVDYSSLEKTAKEAADNAFGGESKRGKIKSPDMVMDFVATQWNIWDSIATIKTPSKGVDKKSKWDSKLLVPMPYVSKIGRNVEYGFAGIEKSGTANAAVITSKYSLSKTPADVTLPYSGSFQMKGMFGFLQGYKALSIEGDGKQLFDVDKGRIISDTQQYVAEVSANIFGLGSDDLTPNIKIEQKISMTLAE
ncbi:MAG: hypothetical protein ABFD79_01600 [Phycisphaerales bacterium]